MTAQLSLFPEEPRPLVGCVTEPWQAWRRFQLAYRAAVDRAVAKHGVRRALHQQHRATVHAALAAADLHWGVKP